MADAAPTIHATAVLVGARAVLIRGPAGSGKSRLALTLIEAALAGSLRFARLVADDRVEIEASHGRLIARPASTLAGLIEVRGLGIRRFPHEPVAVVGLLVDLAAPDSERLPPTAALEAALEGIRVPRLPFASDHEPLPVLLAYFGSDVADAGTESFISRLASPW